MTEPEIALVDAAPLSWARPAVASYREADEKVPRRETVTSSEAAGDAASTTRLTSTPPTVPQLATTVAVSERTAAAARNGPTVGSRPPTMQAAPANPVPAAARARQSSIPTAQLEVTTRPPSSSTG